MTGNASMKAHIASLIRLAGAAVVCASASGAAGQACSTCYDVEFSIDIGSDRELSDPFTPGNNLMDPGDVYSWFRPLLLAPDDGFVLDDVFIFAGFDAAPDDDVAGSAAPICAGGPVQQFAFEFFDLDGVDRISLDLRQFINPDGPIPSPIPRFDAPCIYDLKSLIISFDDDRALNWLNCDVPVNALSAVGAAYGTNAGNDEIMAVVIDPVLGVLSGFSPWLDERGLNVNLAQNPTAPVQRLDDDVDALDINARNADGTNDCPHQYFTADHEAHGVAPMAGPLDPGSIYYVAPGLGAVPVIDDVAHLGLPESTDVDAFEFVWAPNVVPGGPPGAFFAVVFSVDNDDPATPPDESGGLMPGQLYLSYLTGFSVPILLTPLPDDVDGIAAYCTDPSSTAFPPIKCDADVNGDGIVDINDMNMVLAQWGTFGPEADLNEDGIVDINDLNTVLAGWGQTCIC